MKSDSSEAPYTTLYRVHWVENGKTNKTNMKPSLHAFKHMEALLSVGIASWMVPVPIEDDDLPF